MSSRSLPIDLTQRRSRPIDLSQLDISNLLPNSLRDQLNNTFQGHVDSFVLPSSLRQRISEHSRQFNEIERSIARLNDLRTSHDDTSQFSNTPVDERGYSNIRPSRRRFNNRMYQTSPFTHVVGANIFWCTQLGALHEVEILQVLPLTLSQAHLSYRIQNGHDITFSTARHTDLYLPMDNTLHDPQVFHTNDPR